MRFEDPRQIKLPDATHKTPRAKCNRCGAWISLVHKTKTAQYGSRLHNHLWSGRTCYGIPTFMVK